MVEQRTPGTRYIRAFGLFALLAGLALMHSIVLTMGHSGPGHAMNSEHAMSAPAALNPAAVQDTMTIAMATVMGKGHPMAACTGSDCGSGHAGMHGCLFVLAALLLGLGLALLGWVGLGGYDAATTKVRQPRPHRARPPPWTVLSLAELAILRI
ncbi:DUF6153 family protein [Nocardia sp. NPDC051030]|uniref:DUF6153 family protein n=1 Tax=Nocardia sp. NPDC051030 TaxID=3155162 RepID=UPI003414A204